MIKNKDWWKLMFVMTLAMSSGCTLSKGLRGVKGLVELVKCKDTR